MNTPPTSSSETINPAYSARAAEMSIIIDSGSSTHIRSVRSDFVSYTQSVSGNINGFGDGKKKIEGRGEAQLFASHPKGGNVRLRLQNTCYVPDSQPTLISVSQLDQADCYRGGKCVTFKKGDSGKLIRQLISSEKVILTASLGSDRLYHLDTSTSTENSFSTSTRPLSKLEELHQRLGHLSYGQIRKLIRKGLISGVKITQAQLNDTPPVCASCAGGKMTRASFPRSVEENAENILDLVHSDLWTPPVQSLGGSKYAITFTDDSKRWVWVYYLRRKSDAFQSFKEWLVMVERETGRKLKHFHADLGGEFVSAEWQNFLKAHGIKFSSSSARTPEQNGTSERQNRSIFDRVRTVLIDAGLPLNLWAEACAYIVYTKNRNPTSALNDRTPFSVRFPRRKQPKYRSFHRFGCKAFLYNDEISRKKLDSRAEEVIFVGYADDRKAWKVYRPSKRTCASSPHILFDDMSNSTEFQAEGEISYDYSLFKSSSDDSNSDEDYSPPSSEPPAPAPRAPSPDPAPGPANNAAQPKPSRAPRVPKPLPPPHPPSARIMERKAAKAAAAAADIPTQEEPDSGGANDTEIQPVVPAEDAAFAKAWDDFESAHVIAPGEIL